MQKLGHVSIAMSVNSFVRKALMAGVPVFGQVADNLSLTAKNRQWTYSHTILTIEHCVSVH